MHVAHFVAGMFHVVSGLAGAVVQSAAKALKRVRALA